MSVWGASSGKASFQADTALQAVERSNDLAFGKAIERIKDMLQGKSTQSCKNPVPAFLWRPQPIWQNEYVGTATVMLTTDLIL